MVILFALGLLFAGAVASVMAEDRPRMVTGEVVSLDLETRILVLRNEVQASSEEIRFTVAPDAVVRFHGMKGKLEQIKPGDIVTVTYVTRESRNVATLIQHS
jgi:hypothetical protein